jgi:hypothetical protein
LSIAFFGSFINVVTGFLVGFFSSPSVYAWVRKQEGYQNGASSDQLQVIERLVEQIRKEMDAVE